MTVYPLSSPDEAQLEDVERLLLAEAITEELQSKRYDSAVQLATEACLKAKNKPYLFSALSFAVSTRVTADRGKVDRAIAFLEGKREIISSDWYFLLLLCDLYISRHAPDAELCVDRCVKAIENITPSIRYGFDLRYILGNVEIGALSLNFADALIHRIEALKAQLPT